MTTAQNSRLPAFLCALVLLVMNDDWPYVQSARILAETGHIVYNGWGEPNKHQLHSLMPK